MNPPDLNPQELETMHRLIAERKEAKQSALLNWEKRKYADALEQINARRRILAENVFSAMESIKNGAVGDTNYCGIFKEELDAFNQALEKAMNPPFKVVVQPMQASNGLSYFVILLRTDGESVPTFRHKGRMSVINRHDVNEANAEGYAWASFLGVPFTPCEKVEDTAAKNTVPEYGPEQASWAVGDRANPDDIRALGWAVAIHNDYRLNGEAHTFWLFTKDGQAVKGEGKTDAQALEIVRSVINTQSEITDLHP